MSVNDNDCKMFCDEALPQLICPSQSKSTSSDEVSNFEEGHRRDPAAHRKFNGELHRWHQTKRDWKTHASNDNIGELLNLQCLVLIASATTHDLHECKNTHFCNVQELASQRQALVIARQHSTTCDGRSSHFTLIDHLSKNWILGLCPP